MSINIGQKLTRHFKLKEFLHNGSTEGVTEEIIHNLKVTAVCLEDIRALCDDRSIIITSGFRTYAHNREVGGVPKSLHCEGMAADIVVEGLNPKEVQRRLQNWNGGLGCYSEWTHVDWGHKRRW
jgi:uncharacterized protein YcbK (DUF882 family)